MLLFRYSAEEIRNTPFAAFLYSYISTVLSNYTNIEHFDDTRITAGLGVMCVKPKSCWVLIHSRSQLDLAISSLEDLVYPHKWGALQSLAKIFFVFKSNNISIVCLCNELTDLTLFRIPKFF